MHHLEIALQCNFQSKVSDDLEIALQCNSQSKVSDDLRKALSYFVAGSCVHVLKIAKLSSLYKPMSPSGNFDDYLCRMYRPTSLQTVASSSLPMATSNIGESPLLTQGTLLLNRGVFLDDFNFLL